MKKESAKKTTLLDWLYGISCAFVLVCYGAYTLSAVIKGMAFETAVGLGIFLLALLPVLFRKPLKKLLKKAYKPLKTIFCVGMCFYMVTFLVFSTVILTVGNKAADKATVPEGKTPVVLVFGCRSYGSTPGGALTNRLNRAVELLEAMPEAICVVSGSQGENETLPEADAMLHYLTTVKGVDEARIIPERQGSDTIENLRFSGELLEKEGVSDPYYLCVSSEFHTPRIILLTDRMSLSAEVYSAPSVNGWYLFTSLVREYMAYWKLLLFGGV